MMDYEPARRPGPMPLLAPDEPGPFRIVNPGGRAPMLVVCDHASPAIPRALGDLGLDPRARAAHIAWDIGAAGVAERLARRFGARAQLASYSRLVIDLNRSLADPTSIPVISDGTVIPGNRDLPPEAAAARAESLFHPYHRAIAAALDELLARGPAPVLLAVHSFTPVFKGEARPWHVGVLWDRDGRIAVPFMEKLAARGDVCVGDNLPYSGRDHYAFTIDRHAAARGLPHLSMEIRSDLIADPEGVARWSRIVGDVLAEILADPSLYRRVGE